MKTTTRNITFYIINLYTHPNSYNGFLPQGDRGRRRSKFVLYKRQEPNGVKRSKDYVVQSPATSKAILDANQHSISYTLSRNHSVIVEYQEDPDTDMFQVRVCVCLLLFIILGSTTPRRQVFAFRFVVLRRCRVVA